LSGATMTKREKESSATRFVYDWVITVPKGSRGGTWYISDVRVIDASGNYFDAYLTDYTHAFTDTASVGDIVKPKLIDFTMINTTIDSTDSDQTVKGTLTVEDETEMKSASLTVWTPNGELSGATMTKREKESSATRFVYDWVITVPKGSRGGTWYISDVRVVDASGNYFDAYLTDYTHAFTDMAY